MVVEHTFVTTLPPGEAMRRASELLGERGFVSTVNLAFAVDNDSSAWTVLEVHRGAATAKKATMLLQLPQQVRLEWDRGRIAIALSVADRFSQRKREQLLLSIATALESLLARQISGDIAAQEWISLESAFGKVGRRASIAKWTIAALFALGMIGWVIYRFRSL